MRFLIVDLECTCWESAPPAPKETIEIGAVMYDPRDGLIDEFQMFVRPILQPTLSDFCRQLTRIRQAEIDSAPPFPEAFSALLAWSGAYKPFTLSSWGAFDHKQLREDCGRHGVAYPLVEHCNLKKAFAKVMSIRPCGMAGALRRVGLPLEGTHHRGIDDARNIARLLAFLMRIAPDQVTRMAAQQDKSTSQ